MSKADIVYFDGRSILGQGYTLGNEPWVDIFGEPSSDPLRSDCSGYIIGLWIRAKVYFGEYLNQTYRQYFGTSRPTANIMYQKVKRNGVLYPKKFGTLGFRVNARTGIAYHVVLYVGDGITLESGDGTGRVALHTVAWQDARGVIWCEVPSDIGERCKYNPTLCDWPYLRKGSQGPYVRMMKGILNQLYNAGLTISNTRTGNNFGATTQSKLKYAQLELDVKADGILGPVTLKAMQKALP